MLFPTGQELNEITLDVLEQMLNNDEYIEGQRIEYKREMSIGKDLDKKETLADITSFANSNGGFLLFGVEATGGIPTALPGIDMRDKDATMLRVKQMLETGVRPRITLPKSATVDVGSGRCVLILSVEQSWAGPHQIVLQDWCRFYARNANGKTLLDVDQLRSAFVSGESAVQAMRNFRVDRLAKLLAGETLMGVPRTDRIALLVYHFMPLAPFAHRAQLDLSSVAAEADSFYPLAHCQRRLEPVNK